MRKRHLFFFSFLQLIVFLSSALAVFAQSSDPPFTLENISVGIKAVKAKLITAKQLEADIERRKVDFVLSKVIEEELRNTGATSQILKAIKDNYFSQNTFAKAPLQTRKRTINSFKNQQTGMEFVLIPRGSFMMGAEGVENEMPIRKVTFNSDFFIGKCEVTQGEWQALMGNAVNKILAVKGVNNDLSSILGDNYAMVGVNWDLAKEFVAKLNESNDGYVYSLPTEAEWEYACRAGTTTPFAFGDVINTDQASFTNQNFPSAPAFDTPEKQVNKLKPVGLYQPNAWGVYDMHGNAWEWVEDYYINSYKGLPTDGSANLTKGDSERRILRGGGWTSLTRFYLTSSIRNDSPRNFANLATGFRVVAKQK